MPKTLYLMRHGDTGAGGRFIGSTDLPVSQSGFARIDTTAEMLRETGISKVLCSPMLRCRQTFERIGLACAVDFQENLREVHFGLWENKTFSEINKEWPSEVDSWASWSEEFRFPGGEKTADFLSRIQSIKRYIDDLDQEKVLIVSHGGVIRQLICLYLGLSPVNYLLFDIKAGCYSTLTLFSEGGILTTLNSGYSA
ncbi:histidine phosphatase family protein [Desulfosediminicola ganghwensis]|uniref:histidine phosphatase family protein n=1 Tax=Desulfosediminicola ganghwensis TaxID=2569540 RepID=UPI0010ACA457|nr:histidine phosphatase family protein [Desulfosediminicola ganghwensis]